MKILCAYAAGGCYKAEHVLRLAEQVAQQAPGVEFRCVTDRVDAIAAVGVECIQAKPPFPGWWQKLHVFRVHGPCLYLDLDVTITGSLGHLLDAAREHDLIASRDFWLQGPHRINSSVMAWRGDLFGLYEEFAAAPNAHMSIYNYKDRWGDQRFIADTYAGEITLWQNLLPGAVVSYKLGALKGEHLAGCKVLVSHGDPRPWAPGGADAWLMRKRKRAA